MTNRIKSLDVARGFTVFIMPAVHTVMIYSQPAVHVSWPGKVLAFLAEGPGAQLFMFLLGFSIVLSKPKTTKQILTRMALLFSMGYLLNLVRMVVPYHFGVLPDALVQDYIVYKKYSAVVSLLLTGDILQFAAIAYGLLYLIKQSQRLVLVCVTAFLIVIFASPFVWGMRFDNLLGDHLTGLLFADDARSFFPLFPWLCYPVAGLLTGHVYRNSSEKRLYKVLLVAGTSMVVVGLGIHGLSPAEWDKDFYRPGPGRNIFQTGFVMLWICLCAVGAYLFKGSLFLQLMTFCSRNITSIYIFQWVLIAWGTGVAGYHVLNLQQSIFALITTTLLSLLIAWLYDKLPAFSIHKFRLKFSRTL